MHWWRWRNLGDPLAEPAGRQWPTLEERLWARVVKTDTCWIWTGPTCPGDYGLISVGRKKLRVHRLSWQIHNGPIPDGMDVLHECDNPPCMRPSDLFLGTDSTNARDRTTKDRGGRKLTWALVDALRADVASGMYQELVGRRYGITQGTVSAIVNGKSWNPDHHP